MLRLQLGFYLCRLGTKPIHPVLQDSSWETEGKLQTRGENQDPEYPKGETGYPSGGQNHTNEQHKGNTEAWHLHGNRQPQTGPPGCG